MRGRRGKPCAQQRRIIRTGSRRQDIEAKVEELNACLVG